MSTANNIILVITNIYCVVAQVTQSVVALNVLPKSKYCYASAVSLGYPPTRNKAIFSTSVITTKKFSSHNKWTLANHHFQLRDDLDFRVYYSASAQTRTLPVEKQTCSENYRKVFFLWDNTNWKAGGLEGCASKWKRWIFGGLLHTRQKGGPAGCTKKAVRRAAEKSGADCRKGQPSGPSFSAAQLNVQPTRPL